MVSRDREHGSTLVELLVTIVIIGIAFAVIVGGMTTSIFASDVHRQQASAETVMRQFAETVKAATYVDCASNYAYSPPTGFAATVSTIFYGSGDSMSFPSPQPSCPPDPGLQRVSLRVAATNGRDSETLDIVKRK
ncbi:MAG: hypothetical protein QOE35_717 [Actinomycetota bacterium]|jgi:type II secretory pathway pseudopilin PulG